MEKVDYNLPVAGETWFRAYWWASGYYWADGTFRGSEESIRAIIESEGGTKITLQPITAEA